MPLPLPNLDTRRWADLVEEGRALIPRHAPAWTDHNAHDPGITLLELFAWLTEQLIYRANRVPERHLRKFLRLAGFAPRPATPAVAVLAMRLPPGAGARAIPVGTPFACAVDAGAIPFRATMATTLVESSLVAAQSFDGERFTDRSRALREGLPFVALGVDPRAPRPYAAARAPALYLGFDAPIPATTTVTLWLHADDARSGEREALITEERERLIACEPPVRECVGGPATPAPDAAREEAARAAAALHHSARLTWEYHDGAAWRALDAEDGGVDDATRALTLEGAVRLTLPTPTGATVVGTSSIPRHWIRCRLLRGRFDRTPVLRAVIFNAVAVEQARVAWRRLVVAAGTVPVGAIAPGTLQRLALGIDSRGDVRELAVEPAGSTAPELLVLEYRAPTAAAAGSLTLPIRPLGEGSGLPEQHFDLEGAPVARDGIAVHTLEGSGGAIAWRRWTMRADLDASSEHDAHAALTADAGAVRFGDGRRGRVPPDGAGIVASYAGTLGSAGNVAGDRAWHLDDDPFATALLGADLPVLRQATITSRIGASGGEDVEPVGRAAARAAAFLWAHERLVELGDGDPAATLDQVERGTVLARIAPSRATTALDLERIALEVPGTRVRRARAWTALDAADACLEATGTVTLVVVPSLPVRRPMPSDGLLRAVRRWIDRRRVLCTRVVITAPTYLDVSVRATVRALPAADAERVRADVTATLDRFLDPLVGGPEGRGWPFGRDVYRSEILHVIDAVAGVDHVLALSLLASAGEDAREATCDNLCVPPTWLVSPAAHVIDVVSA